MHWIYKVKTTLRAETFYFQKMYILKNSQNFYSRKVNFILLHLAHYVNVLAFLSKFLPPKDVHFAEMFYP